MSDPNPDPPNHDERTARDQFDPAAFATDVNEYGQATFPPPDEPPADVFGGPDPGAIAAEIRDASFNVVGRPVRAISLYYILYYLVEIEDVREAGWDFRQLRDELYWGFYLYGLYTVWREVCHYPSRYYFEGRQIGRLSKLAAENPEHNQIQDQARRALEHTRALSSRYPDLAEIVLRAGNHYIDPVSLSTHPNRIREFVYQSEEDLYIFSRPQRLLAFADDMFATSEHTTHGIAYTHEIERTGETGWVKQYDGAAWAGISDHLQRRDVYPETAWVDQCLALEHNGRGWFDKVIVQGEEREIVGDVLDIDFVATEDYVHDVVVQGLLDAGREEDMGTLYAFATEYSGELEINLRRFGHRFGDPNSELFVTGAGGPH